MTKEGVCTGERNLPDDKKTEKQGTDSKAQPCCGQKCGDDPMSRVIDAVAAPPKK
jgi:hypothetical protein